VRGATSTDPPAAASSLPASTQVVNLRRQLVTNQQQDTRLDARSREWKAVPNLNGFDKNYDTNKQVDSESGLC